MKGTMVLAAGLLLSLLYICSAQPQLIFTEEPQDITVQVGEGFSLSCRAALIDKPNVIPTYTWQKEGNSTTIEEGSSYSVTQATLKDEGVYICMVHDGTAVLGNRNASVTVTAVETGLSEGVIIAIALSLSIVLVLVLILTIILCVWILLSANNARIWDKKSRWSSHAVASRRASIAPGYLSDPKNAVGYAPKSVSKKTSKSLTHLMPEFDDPYKTLSSPSTEDLLSNSMQASTDIEDYNRQLEEQLDKELLNVDESMFEQNPKHTKYKSESNLKPGNLIENITDQSRTIPIEDLSKHHRKQSDPFLMHKARMKHSNNSGTDMDSRRSSLKSTSDAAHSDLSISDDGSGNLFKSVRFDLNEGDSFTDSGVATASSTPYHSGSSHDLERRASAPEIKTVQLSLRRGSAPECYCKPRATDEGIHEADVSESSKVAIEDEVFDSKNTEGDATNQMLESSDSATNPSKDDSVNDSKQEQEQDQSDVLEIFSSFKTTGESEEKAFVLSEENESLKHMDQLRVHYEEQAVPSVEEGTKSEPSKDNIKVPQDKVAEMRLKFQHTGPNNEHNDLTLKIRTRPISKLVSERTQKFMSQNKTLETNQFGSERVNYRKTAKSLKSPDDIPLFVPPVGLAPRQPKKLLSDKKVELSSKTETVNDSDSESSSDDEMVDPISPVKGFPRMVPFGRGFSSKQTSSMPSLFARQSRSEVTVQMRKKSTSVGRLSAIPEESPTNSLRNSS